MGLRVFDGKAICEAWNLKLSDRGKAAQASQAFEAWYEKLKALINYDARRFLTLTAVAIEESEQERFQTELPQREAMLSGRRDSH